MAWAARTTSLAVALACICTWGTQLEQHHCCVVPPKVGLAPSLSREELIHQMLAWLRTHGTVGLDSIHVGPGSEPGAGIGVFAARPILAGERVASVPRALCLTVGKVIPGALVGGAGLIVALAAALLRERRLGSASRFTTYLEVLPRELSTHPLLWPTGLRPSALFAASPRALRRMRLAQLRGAARVSALLKTGAAETEDEARWALAMVDSRGISLRGAPGHPALAMCPLLDLLNHPAPLGEHSLPTCSFVDDPARDTLDMVADADIEPLQEIHFFYGYGSSADLFMSYGFALPPGAGSPPEVCSLEVPVADLQRGASGAFEARAKILRQRGWWRGLGIGRPLLLAMPQNAGSRGLLVSLARLALSSATEVQEFGAELLRGQPLDATRELQARKLAHGWLRSGMARIDSELNRLERQPQSPSLPIAPNSELRLAASKLLQAERVVLDSCSV